MQITIEAEFNRRWTLKPQMLFNFIAKIAATIKKI